MCIRDRYEYFTNTEHQSSGNVTLTAGEYRLYSNKKLPKPEIPVLETAPEILQITLTGEPLIGDTLKASYTFYDLNGDIEGESLYQWYTSFAIDGRGKVPIEGANDLEYILTENELDKFVGIEIIPVAISDELSQGNSKLSIFKGPVDFNINDFTIFPNPFKNEITFYDVKAFQDIFISDFSGKIVHHEKVNARNVITVTLNLEEGVYLVKISNATDEIKYKIIKAP